MLKKVGVASLFFRRVEVLLVSEFRIKLPGEVVRELGDVI